MSLSLSLSDAMLPWCSSSSGTFSCPACRGPGACCTTVRGRARRPRCACTAPTAAAARAPAGAGDLWGPLVLCVALALVLRDAARGDQQTLVFSSVFVIVSCGAGIVTANSQLLGGKLSFFQARGRDAARVARQPHTDARARQSTCVLGYCVLPLTLAALAIRALAWAHAGHGAVKIALTLAGFAWSVFASMGFLGDSQPPHRKALAVYPIVLFYFVIAWMVLGMPTELA